MNPSDENPSGGAVLAWLQLVRLPNLFTAAADVAAGFLFTHAVLTDRDVLPMALLVVASVLLYAAGVVLNDVFDYGLDCRERPERPFPSGRISLAAARCAGWGSLFAGLGLAGATAILGGDLRPGLVALGLAAVVVAYDSLLEEDHARSSGHGCLPRIEPVAGNEPVDRALADAALPDRRRDHRLRDGHYLVCSNRSEQSRRGPVAGGRPWRFSPGVLLLEPLPRLSADTVALLVREPERWTLLLTALAAFIGFRLIRAIANPSPALVQTAVRHCILSLIVLDGAICFVTQGLGPATAIVLLLVPATMTGEVDCAT